MIVRAFLPALLAGIVLGGLLPATARAQNCTSACSSPNCNGNQGTVCCRQGGPDVIVGQLLGSSDGSNGNFSATAENIGGVWHDAFSFGTTSCNVGNQNLWWHQFPDNRHPAIAQNLYRVRIEPSGVSKIEQIGMSWLKHGFFALTQNACGCVCNGTGNQSLGVGCSDPYTASRNAGQSGLGPRWQVDASSGYFPSGGAANPPYSGSTARRLRVKSAELSTTNANVRFFGEGHYVTQDDTAAGRALNNASYREVFFSGGPNEWSVATQGTSLTRREKPGIHAWKEVDPAVTLTEVMTTETPNPLAANPNCCNRALVIVGAKATSLGNGTWHYEYAVQNLNSHRSIASFSVPLPANAVISNIGFHDVDYHSGDAEGNFSSGSINFDGTDWPATVTSSSITWETVPFATNNRSNALRWGTLYNFRFVANVPPTTGTVTLGTYRVVGSLGAETVIPTVPPPSCQGDVTGDNVVNVNDLLAVINAWGPCASPCAADIAPPGGDGVVNVNDLLAVINAWGPCP
jgi:hypothetical protein